ncbi:hypothetical protein [Cytophaga hutchinsonii]|uniref:Lipoprotein n=1 Tax=Cytophaga hutchinsonii (strain ATCC 33406 / DSM 1761 / CIP 103989 / NBRC 15051 / NCIMB 9469 / D465) TaxID=269798 RepID=A0A6N4SVR2_CYTH3|nr:hypothetical protein [Cytophaga hutchinsonii]ABG60614.1 hypothetical protein CHU_3378 [Cytophaga hutchinsonii ATCC 33406]SFX88988.1 hypothetical protein SAMN04487930_11215 [Cytophaga hutchinsonii ATCC 33406]
MKTFYLLLMAVALTTFSCRTKEGAPGPAGESALNKQGSINGTLTFVDYKGDEVKQTFDYAYYETLFDNQFQYFNYGEYDLNVKRRDLKDKYSYISFDAYGYTDEGDGITPVPPFYGRLDFSMIRNVNNSVFDFGVTFDLDESSSTFNVTNLKLDTLSGRITYDFEAIINPNDMYGDTYGSTEATLQGHVDVIAKRKYDSNAPMPARIGRK